MSTATATKKKTVTKKAERGLSYKDVQILFLSDGLAKIEKLLNGGLVSKTSLRRAAQEFANNKAAQSFLDFVEARLGGRRRRGRRSPSSGETRTYKAQQIDDGSLFIRLPVNSLVKNKGQAVTVSFTVDRINVKAG